jgi:release factor glutamine methyltransferase
MMLLLRPPGVYTPQGDTHLLAEALRGAAVPRGARVLEVCTGTGALAIAAARIGAAGVTAIDISARAVLAARFNARLRRLPVRVMRGDLFEPVAGETFDLILANPPYVLGKDERPPRHGRERAWDAGSHGRLVVDRICAEAPPLLAPGGLLLMVHSALCGTQITVDVLRDAELKTSVIARRSEPFGPVMRARAARLEAKGLIQPGQRYEELVVIRGDRTETPD